ncbi:multidrug ABC transporter [Spirochaetia bacterium]|nr:multidrug ABC transporter [Spirochaetia bacterium]
MKTIIAFSVKHPVSVISALIALLLLGIVSVFMIPIDFLPVISSRNLLIAAEYEGISAAEMRSLVTIPLEDSFASLKGLKTCSSVTRDGLSLISIELHWGADIDLALTDSRQIIDICFETLPSGCSKPTVTKNDMSRMDTITIAVIPLDGDLQYGRYLSENDIKPRFQRLGGVGAVTITGGEKEQIQVQVHRDQLEGRRLTLQSVADALAGANFEYPAGTIREGERELSVKTSGLFSSIDEIGNTPLSFNNGSMLRIKDIADIARANKRKETFFLLNDLECIRIGIQKKSDASPLAVATLVNREIQTLEQLYGAWCRFAVIDDISIQISSSLFFLLLSAGMGMFATTIVLYLFLKSIKFALLIAGIIPVSALITFSVLFACGKNLNIMSLSGIAIGIGMVVDAGTVVVENIQKSLEKQTTCSLPDLIINSTLAVSNSNLGSAITTVIVFIPLFFISGLLGELFSDMAIAVIASITVSAVLSLTCIPAMCMLINPVVPKEPEQNALLPKITKRYERIIIILLQYPGRALLIICACLAIGLLSLFFIGYRMLPELASNTINCEIFFDPGTPVDNLQYHATLISRQLQKKSFINRISIAGGLEHNDYATLALAEEYPEKIRLNISLTIQSDKALAQIQDIFKDTNYRISFSENNDILSRLLELKDEIAIVQGNTTDEIRAQALETTGNPDVIIPYMFQSESVFTPDRLAGARFSVSAEYMAATARAALEGIYTLPFFEKGREIPILVAFRDTDLRSISDLENTLVLLENTYVPLRILGTIENKTNEKILYRYNRKDAKQIPYITLKQEMNIKAESPGRNDLQEMIHNAIFLLIIIVILLYLILGAQFESFIIPVLLLIALPPAFSGAFLSLLITANTLNINSIIALVILFGISINNSILLYESCISKPIIEQKTIVESCTEKLQAILITNATTIVALLPFAIDPHHTSAQSSLSIAIIGGLLFSTVIVLLVIPVVFLKFLKKPGRQNE